MRRINANLLHLMFIRWLTVIQALFLFSVSSGGGSVLLLVAVILYCLLSTVLWRQVTDLINRRPIVLQADILIAGVLIWLTGGTWQSPFFLYLFTSLMIVSFFQHTKGGCIAAIVMSILYTIGFVINGHTLLQVNERDQLATFISNYFAFFLIPFFFGYPAYIIDQRRRIQDSTAQAQTCLNETRQLLKVVNYKPLTSRELEVLSSLSQGKSTAQIAAELFISEQTVKNHLCRIYKKLGVSSRVEAILYFHEHLAPEQATLTR